MDGINIIFQMVFVCNKDWFQKWARDREKHKIKSNEKYIVLLLRACIAKQTSRMRYRIDHCTPLDAEILYFLCVYECVCVCMIIRGIVRSGVTSIWYDAPNNWNQFLGFHFAREQTENIQRLHSSSSYSSHIHFSLSLVKKISSKIHSYCECCDVRW